MVLIHGDCHQGSDIYSEQSRGRQCVPNCIIFLCLLQFRNLRAWSKELLHYVLDGGDAFYKFIRNVVGVTSEHLLLSEIPKFVKVRSKLLSVNTVNDKGYGGTLKKTLYYTHKFSMSIEFSINLVFCSENADLCAVMVFCDCAISLVKHENKFIVFDSHSRCTSGFCDVNGSSRIGSYENLTDLCCFLRNLAQSLSSKPLEEIPYELQVIKIQVKDSCSVKNKNILFHFNNPLPDTISKPSCSTDKQKFSPTCSFNGVREKLKRKSTEDLNNDTIKIQRVEEHEIVDCYEAIVAKFHKSVSSGPVYVCSSCSQTWFREGVYHASVVKCKHDLKKKCLTGLRSFNNIEWICRTCKKYLNAGKIPQCSIGNDMKFPHIPQQLQNLTQLEERLISPRIPFMAIKEQARGGQLSLKGNIINVPADVNKTVRVLPRTLTDNETIMVRFKRKLSYKHPVVQEMIRPNKVVSAVRYLVEKPLFKSECILLDEEWSVGNNNSSLPQNNTSEDGNLDSDNESTENDSWDEDNFFENRPTGNLDTVLHPVDFREFNKILNVAPGEGNQPLGIFQDINSEFLSFPTIYCGETRTPNNSRQVPVHYSTISKWELRHVDRRVALNIPNIFFKMKKLQIKFLQDSIQIALRKCKLGSKKMTVQDILSEGAVNKLVKHQEGFQILKSLRGSPAYWEAAKKHLFGMIRQLGIPTWFVSLSAAETKWESLLIALGKLVDKKDYSPQDVKDLSWHEKCRLINSDPVTCVRYFDYRVQKFLKDVVMGENKPLGEIIDFFYRVEFQQRGSPHIHMVVWVQDAPDVSSASSDEICNFIDKHVTCRNDQSIPSLINYQTHRHARTCRKKGQSICRFNFPLPPMPRTVILTPLDQDDIGECEYSLDHLKKRYVSITKKLSEMKSGSNISFEEFLAELNMDEKEYILAIKTSLQRKKVFLRRNPAEIRVNSYSELMLKCWQANIDVQIIIDAYTCAGYVVAYISKGQRGMSNMMYRAVKDAEKNNLSIKEQLRVVGNKFLTHVEIGAQEAVYLVLQMPLRMSSRSSIFIPTSPPGERLTILKSQSILEEMDMSSTDIESDNIVKRYQRRPSVLADYCLADFASWFEISYPSKSVSKCKKKDVHELPEIVDEDNLDDQYGVSVDNENEGLLSNSYTMKDGGVLHKRKKQKIIRCVRYNLEVDPENYYRELIMLYFPWRNECIDIPAELQEIQMLYNQHKTEIDSKKMEYEKRKNLIDLIETCTCMNGSEDESNQTTSSSFMPSCEHNAEQERAEGDSLSAKYGCFDPGKPGSYDVGVDIGSTRKQISEDDCLPTKLSQKQFMKLVKGLNEEQKLFFYHVLHWFKTRSDPLYNFLSGGAGVGKSVLTKAIYQALIRCFNSEVGSNPDDVKVIICAPTGKAAHNVNGGIIHSTFCIPVGRGYSYKPLHMEQLNVYRLKYRELKVVLIDEISMVGSKMLNFINCRLQEIMGVERPFGGVSIIAIGDLYQLKPVMDSWIFNPTSVDCGLIAANLWQDNFDFFELTQIMRQRDDVQFAELLNRLREGLQTQSDIKLLKSKVLTEDDVNTCVLPHLFTSRKEVDQFNESLYYTTCSSSLQNNAVIESVDIISGDLDESKHASVIDKIPIDASKTMGLVKVLKLAEGLIADVSLNINVEDGLTNGASCVIKHFDYRVPNSNRCSIVWVLFNDATIGAEQRRQYQHLRGDQTPSSWTPIFEVTRKFSLNNNHPFQVVRRQFPLHLAAAKTIHKAQGSTLDEVVVHFGSRKWDHMHYVGLSRVRSLTGLHILHLNEEKIAVNSDVVVEMDRLRSKAQLKCCVPSLPSSGNVGVVFHNARSLHLHFSEMKVEHALLKADIIGIAETRLTSTDRNDKYSIEGFELFRNDAAEVNEVRPYHGMVVYSRLDLTNKQQFVFQGIEVTGGEITNGSLTINVIFIYCPPKQASVRNFKMLMHYLMSVCPFKENTVILGDFNIDILRNSSLENMMIQFGFFFKNKGNHY